MTIAPERPTARPAAEQAPPAGPERRRATGGARATDVYAVLGAAAAALALTWLLFARLLPFSGTVGFVLVAYALFLGLYALLVSFDEDGPAVRDRVAGVVVRTLGSSSPSSSSSSPSPSGKAAGPSSTSTSSPRT